MQVLIRRSDLTSADGQVRIFGQYEDNVLDVPVPDGMILLSVSASALQPPTVGAVMDDSGLPLLSGNWREASKTKILSSEASKRIDEVFPEYSQRNSIAEMNDLILKNGADASKWPTAARSRKAEIDRCWNYVNAVRQATTALSNTALPLDPTGDRSWPTKVAPYKPS